MPKGPCVRMSGALLVIAVNRSLGSPPLRRSAATTHSLHPDRHCRRRAAAIGLTLLSLLTAGALHAAGPTVSAPSPSPQTVLAGANAQFAVTASGSGLTYAWQYSSGSAYVTLSNGGRISGATNATLQISNSQTTDTGNYRCLVTSSGGQSNSGPGSLTVNLPPLPTVTAPGDQTVTLGGTATFSVTASGQGPFTYAWQFNGGAGFVSLTNGGRISGAASATLQITTVQTTDAGSYRCLVSNADGQTNSGAATLTVNLPPPPTVTAPGSQTVTLGGTATFSVTASGQGPFTYGWQFNGGSGFISLTNGGRISGATGATLQITTAQTTDAGSYRCLVSNAGGQTNSGSATLTVNPPPPPAVTTPGNQTVTLGGTATFSVTASGQGPFTYGWQFNGGSGFVSLTNGGRISGATGATLQITTVQTTDAGSYRCLVSNASGQTNSGPATLTVNVPPPPTVTTPGNQTVTSGSSAAFSVTASGQGPFTYGWQFNGGSGFVSLGNGSRISGATGATLSITSVQTTDAGVYRCLVSNAGGQTNSGAGTLTVNLPPPPTVGAPTNQTVTSGATVAFTVIASGQGSLTYAWQFNAGAGFVSLGDGGRISGSVTATLTITNAQTTDAGSYRCLVSNAGGQTNSGPATLTVNLATPPTVSTPLNQVVFVGQTVTFTVIASSSSPLTYGWQFNSGSGYVGVTDGGRIAGSLTATLTITNAQLSDAGSYRSIVSNPYGEANSGPATLTVLVPTAPMVTPPSNQVVPYSGTATLAVTATGEGPLVYAWEFNGGSGFVLLADGGRISGSATPTLQIVDVQATDVGSYRCLVSNPIGQTNSGSANLTAGNPDFTLTVSPTSRGLAQGTNVLYTVTVAAVFGFSSDVTLALSGLDPNSSDDFSSNPVSDGSGSSNLEIFTSAATPVGTQTLTVSATGGGVTHLVTITLIVTTAPTPSITVNLKPTQQTVTPGGGALFTVAVNGANLATTVSLTATVPSGITASFDSASVLPGENANLTLTTTASIASGSYPFTVTGIVGALVASASGTLMVQTAPLTGAPSISAISPNTFVAGQVTMATVVGQNLQNAEVSIPTAQANPNQPVQRVFPATAIQSISADGTSMQISVDSTAPGIIDFYNLAVVNSTAKAVTQFRVLPPGPIIDSTTPGTPVLPKDVTFFSLVGAHLRNVTLTTNPPGALMLNNLDTTEDDRTNGIMMVSPTAPAGNVALTVTDPYGQSFTTTIVVGGASQDAVPAARQVIARLPGSHGATTNIYLQPFRRRRLDATRVVRPGVVVEDVMLPAPKPNDDFGISFTFVSTFSVLSYHWQTVILENNLTGNIGSQALQQLALGQATLLSAYVLSAYVEVDGSVYWNVDSSGDFTFPLFCFSFLFGSEVPGLIEQPGRYNYSLCDGSSGTGTTTGSTSNITISSDNTCAQVSQIQDDDGTAFADVTQNMCCNQAVSVASSGTTFLGTTFAADFDLTDPNAIDTSPDPVACTCPCTIAMQNNSLVALRSGDQVNLSALLTNASNGACTYNWQMTQTDGGLGLSVHTVGVTQPLAAGQSVKLQGSMSFPAGQPATDPNGGVVTFTATPLGQTAALCAAASTVCGIPGTASDASSEFSTFDQFYSQCLDEADFGATLQPTATDFTGRLVNEVNLSSFDNCYPLESPTFPQFQIGNSIFPVGVYTGHTGANIQGGLDIYGADTIGSNTRLQDWLPSLAPGQHCTRGGTQEMQIACPWGPVSYKQNSILIDVSPNMTVTTRDNATGGHLAKPQPCP
jgi:hypothetical protein